MYVLTLVAEDLETSSLPASACSLLESEGSTATLHTLASNRALDLNFEHPAPQVLQPQLLGLCQTYRADFALQPVAGRRKKLLLADMESTIIRNEMLDELADFVGIRDRIAEITERAMNGELDFESALYERVELLTGLDEKALESCLGLIEIDPGAKVLISTLKANGVFTVLVSGGFTYFAEPVQQQLGFDVMQANELLMTDGKLSGQVRRPILDRQAKEVALNNHCARLGIEPAAAVAVGDGANDLSMLKSSGLGVAYHGKKHVAEAADFRIDHGDLSTLLFFQGYAAPEWQT